MKVPLLDLAAQHRPLRGRILKGWAKVLKRGTFVLGENVCAFEEEAARFLRARHAIACNSGTDALQILLRALGIGAGDRVLVPAFSFFATAEAVSLCGAEPIFCDIEPRTFHLDLAEVRRKLSPRVRAVIPVHLYGLPMPIRPLRQLLRGREIAVVEDAAQAFGARSHEGFAGTLSDAGAFSFYPTKNFSAVGDAGLMVCRDKETAQRCRMLREHGSAVRYAHEMIGLNSRMDELQAVVLRAKLPRLRAWNARRRLWAQIYLENLQDLPLQLPLDDPNCVWHQFAVRVPGGRRDALKAHLEARGVASAVFYPSPLHSQKPYRHLRTARQPEAERAAAEMLCLPMHAELTPAEARAVCEAVRSFFAA